MRRNENRSSPRFLTILLLSALALIAAASGCQEPEGTVAVRLLPDEAWESPGPALVSFAVPFPDQTLAAGRGLRVVEPATGTVIPSFSKCLAPWRDLDGETGYQRSVLVQFTRDFTGGAPSEVRVEYGIDPLPGPAERPIAESLLDLPEGSLVPKALAVLPAEWLTQASLFQAHRPRDANTGAYARLEEVVDLYFPAIRQLDLALASNWLYDRVSTLYQLYIRSGQAGFLREAHRSATLYAQHIYGESAGEVLRGGFDLKNPPGSTWVDLKYLYPQALALHYLLFGGEQCPGRVRDMVHQFDRATYLLPYQPGTFWTERHFAFRFLGTLYAYSLLGDESLRQSLIAQAEYAFAMQANPPDGLGPDGSWRHYMTDHGEGGTPLTETISSPWMSSLMMEALLEYHRLSGDDRAARAMAGFAGYLRQHGIKREHEPWEGLHPWYLSSSIDPAWNTADGNEAAHNLEAVFCLVLGRHFDGTEAYDADILDLFRDWDDRLDNPPHKFNWALRGALQFLSFSLPETPPEPPPAGIAFTEVSGHGLGNPNWGFGVGLGDLDGDTDPDVVLLGHAGLVEVFRNEGGLRFTRLPEASDYLTEAAPPVLNSLNLVDLDGDQDLDLTLVSDDWTSVTSFLNGGDFDFAWIPETWSPRQQISQLALADLDRDGDLDWVTEFTGHTGGSCIYETLDLGQHARRADLGYPEVFKGCNPIVADFDLDAVADIFIGQCQDFRHCLFRGLPDGTFSEVTGAWGLSGQGSYNGNAADLDNDGDLDLLFLDGEPALYENAAGAGFVARTVGSGLPALLGGTALFADLDNDGLQDFVLHGYRKGFGVYRNLGGLRFENISAGLGLVTSWHLANAADLDADGDLDLIAQSNDLSDQMPPTRLYRNDSDGENHWLSLEVRDRNGNTSAVGAKVWVYRAGHLDDPGQLLGCREVWQTGTQTLVQHFGLGVEARVDVRVRFPDGGERVEADLAANQRVTVRR